jgi:CDP-diacylglycerol pyrophosphatase
MHHKGIVFLQSLPENPDEKQEHLSLHISAIRLNLKFALSNNVEKNNALQAISHSLQHKKSHL